MRESERERERVIERQKERQRDERWQTDRQTDRQTDNLREIVTNETSFEIVSLLFRNKVDRCAVVDNTFNTFLMVINFTVKQVSFLG